MKDFKIIENGPEVSTVEIPSFYIVSRGTNAGEPRLNARLNSYAFYCEPEDVTCYFQYIETMARSGVFNGYLQFDICPYISLKLISHAIAYTIRSIEQLKDSFESIYPIIDEAEHIDSVLNLIECFKGLLLQQKLDVFTNKTGCAAGKDA